MTLAATMIASGAVLVGFVMATGALVIAWICHEVQGRLGRPVAMMATGSGVVGAGLMLGGLAALVWA